MFRIIDAVLFAFERLWQHRILVFWALLGLTVATTLALSLTLYVDAVYSGVLSSRLDDPPYAYRYRYVGSWEGNITQADVNSVDGVLQNSFIPEVDLPIAQQVSYVRGGTWGMRGEMGSVGSFGIGSVAGIESLIAITNGQWPPEAVDDASVPVLIPESMFYTMGVQVGDVLTATRAGGQPVEIEVAAMWRPLNESATTWIFPPSYFDQMMLVQADDLWGMLEGIETPVDEVAWYVVFDGIDVQTSDVDRLIQASIDGERAVLGALPGTRLNLTPEDELTAFNDEVEALTQQLVIMILPIGGMVLYFVSLVAGLLASRQQNEDVTLSSRGMSRRAILGNHLLMWLLLAGAAFGLAIVLAPLLVQLVGQTVSFLQFDATTAPLTIVYTQEALLAGAVTSMLAASSGLILAWRTSGQNINTYRRDKARASSAWWQRWYLDILLLIPAVYVLYTLQQAGGLVTEAENPFSDPLTFLGPTLFALGLTLFFLRVWPFLLRNLAGLLKYSRNVSLLMSLRELTRSTGRYRGTILMMCFTLSLTGYMASMASTLDRSLEDSINYTVGADVVLVMAVDAQTEQNAPSEDGQQVTQTVVGYNTLPPDDLMNLPEVAAVSRVGRYPARLEVPGRRLDGVVLGIDREAIAAVATSREDFSALPYADLFNQLAGQRNGIIINAATAAQNNLIIGQEVLFQFQALDTWYESRVPIIGTVDYFPTLDPQAGFFMLTNIDPLFEVVGSPLPHNFWVSLYPEVDMASFQAEVLALDYPVLQWLSPTDELAAAQAAPARRGVLGFLSVGFVASIVLTLVIAVIQITASFRAQALQLGALRAMGLGGGAVGFYLITLQGIASLSGVLGGTGIGVATTLLFLPLLDFSGGLPPYLVRVAWGEIALVYGVFAAVLLAVTFITTVLLGRERVTTLVKLGDA